MPLLELRDVTKSFGDHVVLGGISLAVAKNEALVLLGASGSGKTTLLRLIAGFELPDRGSIELDGRDIAALPPAGRNFGMVFQHYALFPHLTVGDNVAFGLEARGITGPERDERVREMLELVDLDGFSARRVHEISGGQQQRVALARALAPHPALLLLDEPLSNLDPTLRKKTRRDLRRAIKRVGTSAVWVTHEQAEAFDVGDRVAVLQEGGLEQVGTPEELYLQPASRFVARFVGRASFLPGRLDVDPGRVRLGDARFIGCAAVWPCGGADGLDPGTEIDVLLRPESLDLAPEGSEGLPGEIVERRYAGETTFYRVSLDRIGEVLVAASVDAGVVGDRVAVVWRDGGPEARAFPPAEAGA